MAEEIKEMLDRIKNYPEKLYCLNETEKSILLDYITNLQQENEKLKYNARGQVNDYFKDKYADEVLKNAKLKEENERLNNKVKEQSLLLIEFQDMEQKVDIYKSRCKKAIEYIDEHTLFVNGGIIKSILKESGNNEG